MEKLEDVKVVGINLKNVMHYPQLTFYYYNKHRKLFQKFSPKEFIERFSKSEEEFIRTNHFNARDYEKRKDSFLNNSNITQVEIYDEALGATLNMLKGKRKIVFINNQFPSKNQDIENHLRNFYSNVHQIKYAMDSVFVRPKNPEKRRVSDSYLYLNFLEEFPEYDSYSPLFKGQYSNLLASIGTNSDEAMRVRNSGNLAIVLDEKNPNLNYGYSIKTVSSWKEIETMFAKNI